jgi:hypothetical protein
MRGCDTSEYSGAARSRGLMDEFHRFAKPHNPRLSEKVPAMQINNHSSELEPGT